MSDTAIKAVEIATSGKPVLVQCKGAATADAAFSGILELTALMFRIVFPIERTVWLEPGGSGGWIRVRYLGRESTDGIEVLEVA